MSDPKQLVTVYSTYWYGSHDTIVLVAETEDHLKSQIFEVLTNSWDADEQIPKTFDAAYKLWNEEINCHSCYDYHGDIQQHTIAVDWCELVTKDEQ